MSLYNIIYELNSINILKNKIIELFYENIKDKKFDKKTNTHCGSEGQWLENLLGIKSNSFNKPDLFGFEMKKKSYKITFGDFTANEYIFSKNKPILNKLNKWTNFNISRDLFMKYFGNYNESKKRYSWSGKAIPKYNIYNNNGLTMLFDENLNLQIIYSYSKDTRNIKLPEFLQKDNIIITIWFKDKLKTLIENKFNQLGFFILDKDKKTKKYNKISFGKPFNYDYFVKYIKENIIYFDSGMYEGNRRLYSQFRSNYYGIWKDLIIQEYS